MARSPLTPDRISEAAFALIEEQGLDGFSIRKLGQRLGCEAMSIYHHFPSKAHLMDGLVDRAIGELPGGTGLGFRQEMEASAAALRALGRRRPAFFAYLAVHRLNTPKALAWLDATLGLFRAAGFAEREAAWHFRILGYYLMGAILDETSGYARGPGTVSAVTPEDLARDFPNVAAAGPHFAPAQWDAIFTRGLGIVLDGIEAALPR
jgi:AcrR family transcriptional regulator